MFTPPKPPLHQPSDRASRHKRRRRLFAHRRGVETLEAILALPVLVVATLAVIQFGIAMLVQQAVTTAAIEGAREGGRLGSNTTRVAEEIRRHLAVHNITLDTTTTNATDDARVCVEFGPVICEYRGNASFECHPQGNTPDADQVRVTVCVRMTDGDGHPVPNWLKFVGFSLVGRRIEVSALAPRE